MRKEDQMNHMGKFFLKLGFMASMLLGTSIMIAPADAASITFNFTGVVTNVGSQLGTTTFSNGQTLSGSYTFNSSTVDSNTGATIGRYNGTVSNLGVNIGLYNATLGAGTNFIRVVDHPVLPATAHTNDSYTMQAPVAGPTVNGHTPRSFAIELVDPTRTAFSNDHLPTTPPSLASFATHTFRLVFNGGSVIGTLNSLTASAVPLPAAVILFGAGLIALVGLGAGSWRQKKHSLA